MNATSVRLGLRLHRFEIVVFGAVILALAAAGFVVAGWLDATGYSRLCLDATGTANPPPVCAAIGASFYDLEDRLALPIAGFLIFVPYAAAALLGVAVVAREIERGTTRLAWSMAPSRRRWFAARVLPVLVVLVGLSFTAGLAADRIAGATIPTEDVANSFSQFGQRGGLIAARAVFVFAVAVVSGIVLGRSLPALIVATIVAAVGLAGGTNVHGRIIAGEAIVVPEAQGRPGDLYLDQRFQLPDGRLIDWQEMEQIDPPQDVAGWTPKYPIVWRLVPGERYRFVEAREAAALAGGSLAFLGVGALIVGWRRPD